MLPAGVWCRGTAWGKSIRHCPQPPAGNARKILARTPGRVYLRDTHRSRHAEVVLARSPRGRLVFPALADPFQRLTPSVIATVAASLLALLLIIGLIGQFRARRRA